ncbi:hypothetical protein PSHT_06673 [Puccinia striiformis]|uniref:Uncharacterized protein n=1 Tax=Puccinia striiformis TaxID=27350 RepID=A0A2S4W4M8_9BASI|nr:hypothetical protein PSHT_06673 [Puccinia striiformis]
MTFHIIFFLMSLQNIRHTSNKYPSQFMSEAAYSSTGPDAQITDNLAYTIKDHGLLLHEKEISSSYLHDCDDSYPLKTYAKPDYDKIALWEENKNLKKDVKKLHQKEKKLSRNEKVILGQLEHSEEERYTLEGKLEALRDECTAKAKSLDEALNASGVWTPASAFGEPQIGLHDIKVENVPEGSMQEIDTDKPAEQLLHNSFDFCNSVESHAEAILKLHEMVVGAFFTSKDSQFEEIDFHDKVSLIEELVRQDSDSRSDKERETLMKTYTASDDQQDLDLPTENVLNAGVREKMWNMRWRKLVSKKTRSYAGGVLMVCIIIFHILTNCKSDDERVNAWWYLKTKIDVRNHMQ